VDNKQKLNNLQNRIVGKYKEYNILDSWHYLMIHYGWIPFEEFKKIDAHLVDELITRLNEMNKQGNTPNRRIR